MFCHRCFFLEFRADVLAATEFAEKSAPETSTVCEPANHMTPWSYFSLIRVLSALISGSTRSLRTLSSRNR